MSTKRHTFAEMNRTTKISAVYYHTKHKIKTKDFEAFHQNLGDSLLQGTTMLSTNTDYSTQQGASQSDEQQKSQQKNRHIGLLIQEKN